ncbi:MAG: cell division protein ZapE [Gallionella sp.]
MPSNPVHIDTQAGMSPKDWYQAASQTSGLVFDPAQAGVIEALDTLWHQLMDFKTKRNHFLGRSLLSPDVPKGIYIWGGVGRGKTFLMDGFYECVPYRRKRRIHYHHFMAEVHQRMKQLADHDDPLIALAERIEESTRLLCLDEFHVDDIADAMILGRLLSALFERGVVLITTSNYPPSGLYPHGLQRQNFLPAIAMLERELQVLNLGNGDDYRLQVGDKESRYIVPSDAESEQAMNAMFERVATHDNQMQHPIPHKRIAAHAIWFDFQELCGKAHGQSDYLHIAQRFHTVFLSDIPVLHADHSSSARRLTWLIDVLYDNNVQLVASAAASPASLYTEGVGSSEFHRTVSRMIEMQSASYMRLVHRTLNVTL